MDRFGIDCVVVERSPTTTDHPKSRGCWIRTMEIFRQWGIEQRIRDRGLQDGSDMFVFVESIAGREIGRTRPEPNEGFTPAWKSLVAQDAVEEEIYAELQGSRHARVLFSTECLGFEESADGVTVRTRPTDGGAESWYRAKYVIACGRRRQRHAPHRGDRDGGARHPRGDVERVLEGRPLPLPDHAGGRGLPDHLAHSRRAGLDDPQHQRPRPLADASRRSASSRTTGRIPGRMPR